MGGLFTLNDDPLGKLDLGVLGGPGTGFVVGVTTSTGTASGQQGFTGQVIGQSTSTGTATGAQGLSGAVTGTSTSAGAATGTVNVSGAAVGLIASQGTAAGSKGKSGVVVGVITATGTTSGAPNIAGQVVGVATSAGTVNGTPTLAGAANGANTSTGSATGSPDVPPVPPTPPAPQQAEGFARWLYDHQPRRQPQARPLPEPDTHAAGVVRGYARARGNAVGTCGYTGAAQSTATTKGRCLGVRYPSDLLVARWARQTQENELLTLELL